MGVLVVLDADKEGDPVKFSADLAARAAAATPKPVRVVLAEPEYEQWLYCSAESLGIDLVYVEGRRGLSAIRDALSPTKYVKPVWQPKLTARVDLDRALGRSPDLIELAAKFRELRDLLP